MVPILWKSKPTCISGGKNYPYIGGQTEQAKENNLITVQAGPEEGGAHTRAVTGQGGAGQALVIDLPVRMTLKVTLKISGQRS